MVLSLSERQKRKSLNIYIFSFVGAEGGSRSGVDYFYIHKDH